VGKGQIRKDKINDKTLSEKELWGPFVTKKEG